MNINTRARLPGYVMCDNSEEISTFITIIKTKELVSSDIIIYMKRPNNVQFMCVRGTYGQSSLRNKRYGPDRTKLAAMRIAVHFPYCQSI